MLPLSLNVFITSTFKTKYIANLILAFLTGNAPVSSTCVQGVGIAAFATSLFASKPQNLPGDTPRPIIS